MAFVRRAQEFLYYIYPLRIPLLTAACIIGVWVGPFLSSRAESLLGGIFDVGSLSDIFFVSFTAFLSAWVVMVTWRLIRLYGDERFFNYRDQLSPAALGVRPNTGWRHLVVYGAKIALPIVAVVTYKSSSLSPWYCFLLALLGLIGSLLCLVIIAAAQRLFTRKDFAEQRPSDDARTIADIARKSPDLFFPAGFWPVDALLGVLSGIDWTKSLAEQITEMVQRIPRWLGRGYFEYRNGRAISILPGHVGALALFALTGVFYLWIGHIEFMHLKEGELPSFPTLSYLLLLFVLVCWGLSSLTFFLDRYRIPILIPIVAILLVTSYFPGLKSDYYYTATEPVEANAPEDPSPDSIIVVASSGGGIQAAAWTAKVLTGLEKECREECDRNFGKSVRLISSVSGASVGTMYFVNAYSDGSLPTEEELNGLVTRSEESSLAQISWGLLYPDLRRLFIPSFSEPEWDRGRALEVAWSREDSSWNRSEGLEEGLSKWREDALEGQRPAVIFNTTITETGQRLPLATTAKPLENRLTYEGLFEEDESKTDMNVATAARLSAAFPYISPAARPNVEGPAPHLVDGGYYDNYGVSSLLEWLDEELEKKRNIQRVLIAEIRWAPSAFVSTGDEQQLCPSGIDAQDRRSKQGWFYQAFAPPSTVRNVALGPGQWAHNEAELDLMTEKWKSDDTHPVDIERAIFEFDGTNPPLSWHMTEDQKDDIDSNWAAELEKPCNNQEGWNKVKAFLGAQTQGSD